MDADAEIGLLSPAGSLVPIALHLDRNYNAIASYQHSSQVDGPWLLEQNYIAGSMMAGRVEAVAPWIKMITSISVFEPERGQTDGTVAHGLERTLCLDLQGRGWSLVELEGDADAIPCFGYRSLHFSEER